MRIYCTIDDNQSQALIRISTRRKLFFIHSIAFIVSLSKDMVSSLESFSVELLFEIFEYLSPYDLFRSFINLNDRFNTILYSYPLHLNCQSISRLEFDYICSHIQPKQVISLILSDETIPHQVSI
jgi:hypothetical protein